MKYYMLMVMIIYLVNVQSLCGASYYGCNCPCYNYGRNDENPGIGVNIHSKVNSFYDNVKSFVKPYFSKVKSYFVKPKNLYKGTESEDPCVKKYDNCDKISEYTETRRRHYVNDDKQRKFRCTIAKDGNIRTVDIICNLTTDAKGTEWDRSIGLDPTDKKTVNDFQNTNFTTDINDSDAINLGEAKLGINITKESIPHQNTSYNGSPDKDEFDQKENNSNVDEDNSNKAPISFDAVESKDPLPNAPPLDHGSAQAGIDCETPDGYRDISLEAVEDEHVIPSAPPVEHGSKQAGLNNVNKKNRL